jgi:Na+/H+ antiporter NhaD/arsenite permease-like protein
MPTVYSYNFDKLTFSNFLDNLLLRSLLSVAINTVVHPVKYIKRKSLNIIMMHRK